jgi:hypothetical protein
MEDCDLYTPTEADWQEFDTWCRNQDAANLYDERGEAHV